MESVKIRTADGLELDCRFFGKAQKRKAAPKSGMVFIHGWKDDAGTERFAEVIAEKCEGEDIGFLAFSNRGAGEKGATENFEDCILDIEAAVSFMEARGYGKAFLLGHSTGCQKAAYYWHKKRDGRVEGMALLEPTDDAALAKRELGERYGEAILLARKNGNRMMPGWAQVGGKISAARFLSMFSPDETEGGLFDFGGDLGILGSLERDCLIIFGSKSAYNENPKEKAKKLMWNMPSCQALVEGGADHHFHEHEERLADILISWIKERGEFVA
ncbi:MAG: alpha/beta hydrolase [Candidatus Micrarchaeota archaeon]